MMELHRRNPFGRAVSHSHMTRRYARSSLKSSPSSAVCLTEADLAPRRPKLLLTYGGAWLDDVWNVCRAADDLWNSPFPLEMTQMEDCAIRFMHLIRVRTTSDKTYPYITNSEGIFAHLTRCSSIMFDTHHAKTSAPSTNAAEIPIDTQLQPGRTAALKCVPASCCSCCASQLT